MGIGVVIDDLPGGRKRVDLEGPSQDVTTATGNGSIMLAFSLYIAAATLGWPDKDVVTEVFDRFSV